MSKIVKVSGILMVLAMIATIVWSKPTTVEAVEAKVARYESGFTIIPGREIFEEPEAVSEEDEEYVIEYPDEDEIWMEVVFHVDIPGIKGLVPNAVQSTQAQCPITEEEVVMLAKTIKREAGGITWDAYGVSGKARQAAVGWCALNRLDSPDYPDTLKGVLTFPNAFAYIPETYVSDELLDLAHDIVDRWWREKCGEEDVGRTLPPEFFFFHGDGRENHFRTNYSAPFVYWDWTLPDPYYR